YFAFVGYLLTVVASFNLMGLMHFAYRRRLWIIFLLSSFASVIVQVSSTETDIIITALVLSSMYLFWSGVKEGKRVPVYFAALCYALAIGTKTPSILMIPSVGFFMLAICAYYKKLKPFLTFLGFGVVNFVVFSAYNYVLNLVHYGNIAGSEYFMIVSKNYDGFRGACANFIKYLFMFVDFTGFRWSDYLMNDLINLRTSVLSFFNLAGMQDGIYSTDTHFQRSLIEQLMGAGILGFLVFLPCWIISLFMGLSKKRNRRKLCVFGIMMLINLAVISYSLSYMTYSVRFLMSFMLLSAPVLYYSYFSNRNILKYVIIYFATFYLALVSTHIWVRPFFKVVNFMKTYPSVQKVREVAVCQNFYVEETPRIDCKVRAHIKSYPKDTRFLYLPEAGTNYVGIAKLILEGYRIDIGEAERLSFGEGDLDEYDVIISPATRQRATNIVEYERRKDDFAMDTRFKGETIRVKRQVERPFDCLYEYNPRIDMFDAEGNRRVPYAVRCSAKPAFFKSKGFDIARVVGNKYEEDDGKVSNIYLFYEKE
ncbi:hypothetical protein IJV79_02425, partial [bacterium]|nr:hypothetical protein [bacterium]